MGHAVRATYMYSGMADVAALTGDRPTSTRSIDLGERRRKEALRHGRHRRDAAQGEAFGADYELPNMTAYNETCAAVGNDLLESAPVPAARRRASTST